MTTPIPVPVVHLVPALFQRDGGVLGGAERYVEELARHMAEVVPTELVSFGREARVERAGSLTVRVLSTAWRVRGNPSNPLSPGLLPTVLRAGVVHCHQKHILSTSLAAIAARLSGKKIFVTDYGGGGWDLSAFFPTDRWFDGELHLSRYSGSLGKNAVPGRIIHGGVDTAKFSPGEKSTERSGVLFVGRLLPHKGVDVLLDALTPELSVDIIGQAYDSAYRDELRRRAEGRRVHFRENCDDEDLVAAYRKCAVVVLPSVYRDMYGRETRVPELLGQTLLEAMACGAAVVASDVASLPELVVDGRTGFLVPPGDSAALREKLLWLAGHPDECRAMGAAGRKHVMETFRWSNVVERCLSAYGGGEEACV